VLAKFVHIMGVVAVFVTTGGVSISSHYCGGSLIENSLMISGEGCWAIEQSDGCCMSDRADSCTEQGSQCVHDEQNQDDKDEGCCHTITNMYVLDQTPVVQSMQLKSLDNEDFWSPSGVTLDTGLLLLDRNASLDLVYFPPALIYNRQARFGIFRC
jgi:hypothetical protein